MAAMAVQVASKAYVDAIATGQASGVIGYDTLAALEADLAHDAGTVAYVTNDPDPANNGTYRKTGASGTGSWVQASFDRVALVEAEVASITGGAHVSDQQLRDWTEAEAYEVVSVTRDADGVVTSASVQWPDGSAGTFTTLTRNDTWLAVDAYSISHDASGKVVTQAAVTRSDDGAVSAKPALAIVAAPAFVAATTAKEDTGSTITIARPDGTMTGDVLIAVVRWRADGLITAPAGWTLVDWDQSTGHNVGYWVRTVAGGEAADYTWTQSAPDGSMGAVMAAYRGTELPVGAFASTGELSGTGSSVSAPSVTTTVPLCRIVRVWSVRDVEITEGPGTTLRAKITGGGATHPSIVLADAAQIAAGATGTSAATFSSIGSRRAATIALEPAT